MYKILILNISLDYDLEFDNDSDWINDSLYVFILLPLGVLGAFLNSVSLCIISKRSIQRSSVFKYIRIYSCNSVFISATSFLLLFLSPKNNLTTSYKLIKCLIFPTCPSIFYCFANVLDVLINVNRILSYSRYFRAFRYASAYKISMIAFVFVVMINIPYFFLYDFNIISNTNCIRREFFVRITGKLALAFSLLIQGPLLLLSVAATNGMSIIAFRRFYKSKIQNLSSSDSHNSFNDMQKTRIRKNANYEKNILFMTIYMTAFSFLVHLIQFCSQMLAYLVFSLSAYFEFLQLFVVLLKQTSNFVFFYCFNKKFRKYFNACFQF